MNELKKQIEQEAEKFSSSNYGSYHEQSAFTAGANFMAGLKDEWVSVSKDQPPINKAVLLNIPAYRNISTGRLLENGEWEIDNQNAYGNVTHWMPLPKAPLPSPPKTNP